MFVRPRFFYGLLRLARSLATVGVVVSATVATGCVAHRGYQPVGTGRVTAGDVAASAAPGAGNLSAAVVVPDDLPDADLRVDYQLWLPRAMEVTWQVRCGDVSVEGEAGETFEAYRVRRLAELRAERERAQRNAAAVGSLVGGAVLGQHAASVGASGPGGSAEAGVVVDGADVGAAAGAAMVSTDVALAADDVGAGYRRGQVVLQKVPAGSCSMQVAPLVREDDAEAAALAAAIDPALLTGTFTVARRDDPARRRALVAARGAVEVRGTLHASLVAAGADPDPVAARARNEARWAALRAEREAEDAARRERERVAREADEARARVRMEARLELEARARLEARLRWEGAMSTRGAVLAYLGECGADPHHRERVAAEARARAELEAQLVVRRQRTAFALRGHLHARLVAAGADPHYQARLRAEAERTAAAQAAYRAELAAEAERRARMAAGLRDRVSASLVASGAVVRPPMPPAPVEDPGPAVAGALWVGGHWVWSGVSWEWSAGQWVGGAISVVPGVTVTIGGSTEPLPPPPVYVPAPPAPPPGYVPPPPPSLPVPAPAPERPQHRDHRNGAATTPAPSTPPPAAPARPRRSQHRDHRDGQ